MAVSTSRGAHASFVRGARIRTGDDALKATRAPSTRLRGPLRGELAACLLRWAHVSLLQPEALRAVLEHMPESIAVYDCDGRLIYANPATEAMFGRPRDALYACRSQ